MTISEKKHMKEMATELANRPLSLVIAETGLFIAIALAALLGNSYLLYVFYKSPRLRSVTSYYIITLAISDIAMSVLIMSGVIAVSACGCDALGYLAGSIMQWILTELLFGSLQTTSLIAINRYFCVVKPSVYRRHFRPKSVMLMIVGTWVFNLIPIIAIFTSGITSIDFYASRYMRFPYFIGLYTGRVITAAYQVLFTIFPATLSIVCYWKIHQQIKRHKASLTFNRNSNRVFFPPIVENRETSFSAVVSHRTRSSSIVSNHEASSAVVSNREVSSSVVPNHEAWSSNVSNHEASSAVVSNHEASSAVVSNREVSIIAKQLPSLLVAGNQTAPSIASSPSPSLPKHSSSHLIVPNRSTVASSRALSASVKEIKITKSLMVIVIGFCVCWFPSSTILHLSSHVHLPRLVEALLLYCGFASSAINPILYSIYNRPFRKRALQLLRLRNILPVDNKFDLIVSSGKPVSVGIQVMSVDHVTSKSGCEVTDI